VEPVVRIELLALRYGPGMVVFHPRCHHVQLLSSKLNGQSLDNFPFYCYHFWTPDGQGGDITTPQERG